MEWITDPTTVDGNDRYLVLAIGQRDDKSTYLYEPQVLLGWQFKRLTAGCYAAIPMPEWKGLPSG